MKTSKKIAAAALMAVMAGACASPPLGPSVAVMPAPNKPFDVFANEQAGCESYASLQVNGQAKAANDRSVGRAVLTTALGAGLGAAVGGGRGAAIGAGSGAVVGALGGAARKRYAADGIQRRYDIAYEQCMYAKGNQVPGYAPAPPPPPDTAGP